VPCSVTHSAMPGSSRSILNGMAADQRIPRQTVARKASGWIFGRWGATPAPSAAISRNAFDTVPARSTSIATTASVTSDSSHGASDSGKGKQDLDATPKKLKSKPHVRMPGINQSGPILGFWPEVKMQHPPVVNQLDEEALRKALDDE
jgi:hypothetical protein